jgi:hypothetical protein
MPAISSRKTSTLRLIRVEADGVPSIGHRAASHQYAPGEKPADDHHGHWVWSLFYMKVVMSGSMPPFLSATRFVAPGYRPSTNCNFPHAGRLGLHRHQQTKRCSILGLHAACRTVYGKHHELGPATRRHGLKRLVWCEHHATIGGAIHARRI